LSEKTPAIVDHRAILEEIRAGVEDLRARRDEIEERSQLVAALSEFRTDLARLESKLDAHSRSLIQRLADVEKRLVTAEGEIRDLKGIAKTLREAHARLELYRREETRPFGQVPPDEG
jgi:chromosome segregation ATPase